jgi:hypothetical protein
MLMPLDGVSRENAAQERDERGDHRHQHGVEEPLGIRCVEQQLLDVRERRVAHPERIALARQQLLVRLERRDRHPVEREEQHEQESGERQVDGHRAALARIEVRHARAVDRRRRRDGLRGVVHAGSRLMPSVPKGAPRA